MAPKVKITKEDIVRTAVELIRGNGEQAFNARALADALKCSTQPIFFNFRTMADLEKAVITEAYSLYLGFIESEVKSGKYPRYKAFGMAYIRFAYEERELFRLLFMRDRTGEDITPSLDFEQSVQIIMESNGISRDAATLMHLEIWTCVHGIATMLATSFLSFEWELISDILTDVYQGIRQRHLSEERKNDCN
jgi:AcrR family transcriptional regulator